jgi:hypothetical protein
VAARVDEIFQDCQPLAGGQVASAAHGRELHDAPKTCTGFGS